ncbi:hypothetical protein E8E13_000464 [Curvularia kusanoi]|uniref:Amino acid transporter n=1 Tax=Curvularia kusanoi TaxID=90978 RepID=A0A9P4T576_CURKU|nr:hypothetical protein E8E13_000464 [Curvularia kusanoi]
MSPTKAGFEDGQVQSCDEESQQHNSEKEGTANDRKDMYRMGKQQELRRNFGLVSIFGYSMILMATWENTLTTLFIPLTNGGPGGAIVMFLVTTIGMGLVVVSMAEMASMQGTHVWRPASEVFSAFQDNAGWGSIGLSVMLGQLAPIFSLLGSDAATHMSEELQDASHTLPRAMIWTGVVNSSLGFVMLLTFMICLGDNGLPLSGFLAQVHPDWDLPLNSVIITFATVAFNTIASMGTAAILSSYAISITCMFYKRCQKEELLPSKFSLGKSGIWVNGMAVLWLLNAIGFAFFPTYPHPTPDLFNWNILIYGIVVTASLAYFYARARNSYVGPVQYLNKDA